jgi:hypothetical protein
VISNILELDDQDAGTVSQNLARIMKIAGDMAETGSPQGFRIYKLARDSIEIMAMDRISRKTLAQLGAGREIFQGWQVSDVVLGYMKENKKINAIKEFRGESGLGLKEAKDWVEAYMHHRGLGHPF